MPATPAQLKIIENLKKICQKKGYAFFENGDYNLNIIAVRENDNFENEFSDTLYVAYKVKGVWELYTSVWTTLAGTLGFGGEKNPLTGQFTGTGVDGVAVILEGQYRGAFRFENNLSWLNFPYLRQVKPLKYLRDNDKNGLITRNGKVYEANYQTHLHRMTNDNVTRNQVNTITEAWSQGCNGSPHPNFKELINLVTLSSQIYGNIFTYTMLHRKDF